MRGLPRPIEEALAALDQPWELKLGSRHLKIIVCGQLAGILPRDGKCHKDTRSVLNTVAQIKKVARTGQAARRG